MSSNTKKVKLIRLISAAMFLALALVLPFLTGQNRQLGNMLCLMHLPVLLCGFVCGPAYGAVVGAAAPLLRHLLFGMPPAPTYIAMCFELCTYGVVAALLYRAFPKKPWRPYAALIGAMLAGRILWGAAMVVISGLGKAQFGWGIFWANGFVTALPGIALQIVLIPLLILALEKALPNLMKD